MAKINTKQEALDSLNSLPEKTLIRLAELSAIPKAKAYFDNPIKYGVLKAYINQL